MSEQLGGSAALIPQKSFGVTLKVNGTPVGVKVEAPTTLRDRPRTRSSTRSA